MAQMGIRNNNLFESGLNDDIEIYTMDYLWGGDTYGTNSYHYFTDSRILESFQLSTRPSDHGMDEVMVWNNSTNDIGHDNFGFTYRLEGNGGLAAGIDYNVFLSNPDVSVGHLTLYINGKNSYTSFAISDFKYSEYSGSLPPSTPVPEPTTMLLVGTGIASVIGVRITRNKRKIVN